MSKPVRLGLVGAGMIGRLHLEAAQSCKRMEVAAVCDVHAGRARSAAAEFGIPHTFTDHRELFRADLVDAVLICTPNNTHMPIGLAAARAGKHVLCEKPLAMNARQARRMVGASEKAGRILMSAQSARYSAGAQFVKQQAESGRFGKIYYGKAVWFRRAGIPRGWFQDAEQSGGGPLLDLGVHAVDLMWWVMGRPEPVSAYGATFGELGRRGRGMGGWGIGYGPGKFSVEDLVAGMVRFGDGRALGLDISWAAHTEDLYWVRLFGTKAGAQLGPKLVLFEAEGETEVDVTPRLPEQNAYAAEIQHFIDCIQGNREPISPGWQSVVVMEMLDAVYRSARTGRAVSLRTR